MNVDVKLITAATPKAALEVALTAVNTEAKATHPSPRYDYLHSMLNLLLTYWQAADG